MAEQGIDVLLLSVGPDLPWLTGYEAMPLERLTMLVVPRDGDATLVVPAARGAAGGRAARRVQRPRLGRDRGSGRPSSPSSVRALRERRHRRPHLGPVPRRPATRRCRPRQFAKAQRRSPARSGRSRTRPRSRPCAALRPPPIASPPSCRAARIPLVGRTEAEVSADLGRRLLAEGHQRVNFAIVAAGENAASPHHEPGRAG